MLAPDLLDQLEEQLRRQGAPVAELLRPGLTDAQIDQAIEPLGLSLPEELRVWWRWHDGTDFGPDNLKSHGSIGSFPVWPLAHQVEDTLFQRQLAEEWADDEPELAPDWWADTWMAVTDYDGNMVACDCSGPAGQPAPTFIRGLSEPRSQSAPGADSFGRVVGWWVEALSADSLRWDADGGFWDRDDGSIPAERRSTGLV